MQFQVQIQILSHSSYMTLSIKTLTKTHFLLKLWIKIPILQGCWKLCNNVWKKNKIIENRVFSFILYVYSFLIFLQIK